MPAQPSLKQRPRRGLQILDEQDVPVQDLHDDPGNVNVHDERNLEALRLSMERFGQPERLIVRKKDLRVFNGNGRLEVMRRIGWSKARVQFVQGSDAECMAYAVAANRTGRLSRFNDDDLHAVLADLEPGQRQAAGYNEEEFDRLLQSLAKETPPRLEDPIDHGRARTHATCPKCGHNFAVGGKPA